MLKEWLIFERLDTVDRDVFATFKIAQKGEI